MIGYRFFKKLLNIFLVRSRIFFSIDSKLDLGEFKIYLPPEHLLAYYKKTHRLYDKFLPFYCQYLHTKDIVIDVGANVGDTLAAMYSANPGLEFICIEPDDYFFGFLKKNALIISEHDRNSRITLLNNLIGNLVHKATLEGVGGTKKAVVTDVSSKSVSSISLDDVLENRDLRRLKLLKVDVDGYDFDVIDSGLNLLKEHKPVIFFETDFDNNFQLDGYKSTLRSLIKIGYESFILFDNFGEVLLITSDVLVLEELLEYVRRMNLKRSTRTIYYYDVLAYCRSDSKLIDKIISEYKEI